MNSTMHQWLMVVIISLLLSLTGQAVAQTKPFELVLTRGVDRAQPIAVVPFAGEDELPEDQQLSKIITHDLNRSGQFTSLPSQAITQFPSQVDAVNYQYWRQHLVDNLIIGSIEQLSTEQYRVSFTLLNVFNPVAYQQILLEKSFIVSKGELRRLAHHISDLVYQELTGERGIFTTRIAYILVREQADGSRRYTLEVADADGYNPRSLLLSTQPIMSPAWSPDGKHIAYVSFEKRRAEIYTVHVATGKRRLISSQVGINGAPAWSPDGKRLAVALSYENQPNIYLIDVHSGYIEQVTYGTAIDTEPAFSPDGQKIIFTSDRGGTPQIYQVDLTTKKVERLTFTGKYNTTAQFTPDGQRIVMLHKTELGFNIAEQSLHTGALQVLTHTKAAESPTLAPNGKWVLYADRQGGRSELKIVSIEGRVHERIPTPAGYVQEPAWSPFF